MLQNKGVIQSFFFLPMDAAVSGTDFCVYGSFNVLSLYKYAQLTYISINYLYKYAQLNPPKWNIRFRMVPPNLGIWLLMDPPKWCIPFCTVPPNL